MNVGPRLAVGDTLNEVFALYREHFGVLIPAAFWLFLAVSILVGISTGVFILLLISGILVLAVGTLYQGMVVSLVHRSREAGSEPTVGELIGSVSPVLTTLVVASVLAAIGEFVGLIFFIVPGCILLTIWAVIAPAIVIERLDLSAAFTRSQNLVKGFGWPVFGAVLSANLIAGVATLVLGNIGEAIAGGPILRVVLSALATTFAAPIPALTAAVLYHRLLALKGDTANEPSSTHMPPAL